MSRSAADATRFTATGPYASSKASGKPYNLPDSIQSKNNTATSHNANAPNQSTGPDGKPESPREKVERLRAQARANRMVKESLVDRWVASGQKVANKAHKGMVYTLIAATGICGVLTVYSMVSLTLYNRRQKKLWIERELEFLKQARIAYAAGTATPEQIEMVKNEEIGAIYKQKKEEEKAQRPWNKAKRFLAERLGGEEQDSGVIAVGATTAAVAAGEDARQTGAGVMDAVNAKRAIDAAASKTKTYAPGQLDVMAQNAERAAQESTKGWVSWLTGR
ncbi:hypothetical protein N7510_006012 [Penicillium lagena]|uniref:uncharacterized protein n=1 Tax=Penicillium lagena TaxID=94218 RepID=UPI0025404634|nr:uncharacterized protein N7510_006012 [Penicillium lagena]KAJ5612818.1 hypothetical protein N7510_006012 [Penicillium lagena]